jgi:virginiamycin A acetyltransferase
MSLSIDDSSYIIHPYHIESFDSRKENGELPLISIGKYCSIARNCTFVLSHHKMNLITTAKSTHMIFNHNQGNNSSYSRGDIIIKNDVWIGVNSTIMDNITIENGAVIAAGSVVTKSVPPYAIVGGNPAKILKYRFSENIIHRLENLQFWDMPVERIRKFDLWSEDIEDFINSVTGLNR